MRLLRTMAGAALAAAIVAGCGGRRAQEYELRGQVLAVDRPRLEITIKHEDIPRFMPGMTMPFKVKEPHLLDGRVPGDLVTATLVVGDGEAHLRTIERTGSAPLTGAPPTRRADALLNPGDVVPDAAFVDQTGAARRLSDWRDRVVAVTFTYTRCPLPEFCPLIDRNFLAVQRALASDPPLRDRVTLLSISVDPVYDRPPILAAHARRIGADPASWTFLTGERGQIEAFAWRFGVSIVDGESAGEIVHNLRTAIVGGDGRLAATLRGNEWTPDALVAALRKAADGRR